jgi:hypothetical protein
VWIAAESIAPELVVENHDVIVAGLGVFGNEMPPENHFCSKKEVEEAGRYAAALVLFRPIGRGDGEALSRPCVERLEDLALFLPVEIVAGGSAIALAFLVRPDHDEPVAVGVRERREQHRVEQTEDGSRGPNAQGQSEQGHRSEARAFPKQPQAVTNVPSKFGHKHPSRIYTDELRLKFHCFRPALEFRRLIIPGKRRSRKPAGGLAEKRRTGRTPGNGHSVSTLFASTKQPPELV